MLGRWYQSILQASFNFYALFHKSFWNSSDSSQDSPPPIFYWKKSFLLASPFTGQSRFCLCLCNSAQTEQHKQLFSVLLIMRVAFCGYHLDMKHLSPRFETFDMIKLVQGKRDGYWNRVSDRLYWYSIRNPLINFFFIKCAFPSQRRDLQLLSNRGFTGYIYKILQI